MFDLPVQYTPFNTRAANLVFGTKVPISTVRPYQFDETLLVLTRALVAPRLPEGMIFSTYYGKLRSETIIDDEVFHRSRNLRFIQANVNADRKDEFYRRVSEAARRNGFEKQEKVSRFFEKKLRVDCYVNEAQRRSVVVHDADNLAQFHHLMSAFIAFVPWIFKNGVTNDEMELIRGLTEKTPDRFMEAVDKLANGLDSSSAIIDAALSSFESNGINARMETLSNNIRDTINEINDLQLRISRCLTDKMEYESQYLGLQRMLDGTRNGILRDFFKASKNLELFDYDNDGISFLVRGYLTYWNEEDARSIMDSPNGFAYVGNRPAADTRLLLRAVFINQTVRLRMCAAYALSPTWVGAAPYDYESEPTYTANPHLKYHSCLGGYESEIQKCLVDGDYVGAVESAVASCSSVNLLEAPTARPFLQDVFYTGKKVFEMSDGRLLSSDEAIAALKEERENG